MDSHLSITYSLSWSDLGTKFVYCQLSKTVSCKDFTNSPSFYLVYCANKLFEMVKWHLQCFRMVTIKLQNHHIGLHSKFFSNKQKVISKDVKKLWKYLKIWFWFLVAQQLNIWRCVCNLGNVCRSMLMIQIDVPIF